MKLPPTFKIDVTEKFTRLPNAPIAEAVIQWQATPTKPLEQISLEAGLKERFPGYEIKVQQRMEAAFQFTSTPQEVEQSHKTSWDGFRLTSQDKKHICQFKPNMVVFSRLAPYDGWDGFHQAATLFWQVFLDLAAPDSVDRIGVRYISQVNLKDEEKVSDYVEQAPAPLQGIGLSSETFFHQDSISLPGYPYRLNLVRTIQPAEPPLIQKSLIVDIDVSTTAATSLASVETRLKEMRFIKNKAFFSFMKNAEDKFK